MDELLHQEYVAAVCHPVDTYFNCKTQQSIFLLGRLRGPCSAFRNACDHAKHRIIKQMISEPFESLDVLGILTRVNDSHSSVLDKIIESAFSGPPNR